MNSDLPKCSPPVVMDTNACLSDLHFSSNGYNVFQLLIGAGIGFEKLTSLLSSPKCQPVGNFQVFDFDSPSQLEADGASLGSGRPGLGASDPSLTHPSITAMGYRGSGYLPLLPAVVLFLERHLCPLDL